ncbi:hypothetical protein HMPREF0183_0157 [Brevibacterium mcbrellneri ATCC 49030]|uniref:Uncharacterized protein n=1 Tax=Brevibacterium mcbrellneri ATCC 49030 TaxID=585530 RepID=D4YJP7_9MICO|nr:hypothetical protein HMPREF0183_0157 [Brevibacterium mcbrellneri ATCC 49030]
MKPKIDNPEESTSPENTKPKNKHLRTKGAVGHRVMTSGSPETKGQVCHRVLEVRRVVKKP